MSELIEGQELSEAVAAANRMVNHFRFAEQLQKLITVAQAAHGNMTECEKRAEDAHKAAEDWGVKAAVAERRATEANAKADQIVANANKAAADVRAKVEADIRTLRANSEAAHTQKMGQYEAELKSKAAAVSAIDGELKELLAKRNAVAAEIESLKARLSA